MPTNVVRSPIITSIRPANHDPVVYLKSTGKGGTGSQSSPLAVENLSEVWEDLSSRVVLLPGVYPCSYELKPKHIKGFGRDITRIVLQQKPDQTKWARGVIRGDAEEVIIEDVTVQCPDVGPSCNGISLSGNYNQILRCGVDHLWGAPHNGIKLESFGLFLYGADSLISECLVDNIQSNYASAICPVGWRHKIIRNRVIGNGSGGRNSAYSIYSRDGLFLHNYGTRVNFWIYGDSGGHTPEMKAMDWLGVHLIGNWGDATEAAIRIQSIRNIPKGVRAQHYGQMIIEGNEWTSERSVSVFQTDTSNGSAEVYHEAEHFGFDFRNNTFNGQCKFMLDTVPGCVASGNKFEQQPTFHPEALPIRWLASNSHPYLN